MLHFWAKLNYPLILRDDSRPTEDPSPNIDHLTLLHLIRGGFDSLSSESLLRSLATYLHCAWVILIECRERTGAPAFTLINEVGERHALRLDDVKDEFRGFLHSILGIDDESLLVFENSVLSRRKGLIHLLNGLGTSKSGLQSLLRTTVKSVVNLVGFRLTHPESDFNDANSGKFVAVVAGRYWGVLDSSEVCPRVGSLSVVFDLIAEHRSMLRSLDESRGTTSKLSAIESSDAASRVHASVLNELWKEVSFEVSSSSIRSRVASSLKKIGDVLNLFLNIFVFEEFSRRTWTLSSSGEWIASDVPLPEKDIVSKRHGDLFRSSNVQNCIISVDNSTDFTIVILLSVGSTEVGEGTSDRHLEVIRSLASMLRTYANSPDFLITEDLDAKFESSLRIIPDFAAIIQEELSNSEMKLVGSSLLNSLVDDFLPYFNIFPVYVGNDETIDLSDLTTLPGQLSSSIRSLCLSSHRNDKKESSFSFQLLGLNSLCVEYFSTKYVGRNIVPWDRALFLYDRNFMGLRTSEDVVVFFLSCSKEALLPPVYFNKLREALRVRLFPFQTINRIAAHVASRTDLENLRLSHEGLSEWGAALQTALNNALPDGEAPKVGSDDAMGTVQFYFAFQRAIIGNYNTYSILTLILYDRRRNSIRVSSFRDRSYRASRLKFHRWSSDHHLA